MKDMKDKYVMIIGAGRTITDYHDRIISHINTNNIITIGINYMTSLCVPDYHLWTNKQRWGMQHHCISKKSKLLLGSGMPKKNIKMYWGGEYQTVNYKNSEDIPISYKNRVICGNFRTAGILAIMIAYINGSKKIDIVGMDGYTLYPQKELENGSKSHHCYGRGYTDDADWEKCLVKDDLVNKGLRELKEYGVNFRILTPTKFKEFYVPGVI